MQLSAFSKRAATQGAKLQPRVQALYSISFCPPSPDSGVNGSSAWHARLTWDAWLPWLLSHRAKRHKLPLWLSFTWVKIITRLNYSQAMLLGALKVAEFKSWLQKVAQTGLYKGKLIQCEFTTCLQFRSCFPVPSWGRVGLPNHSLPIVAKAAQEW